MSGLITVPFHIGDFLSGTLHMSTEEKGAYVMLMLAHYQAGGEGLPNDDKMLSRIAGLTMKKWKAMKGILEEKFEVTDSHWRSKKCVEVIQKVTEKSSAQRAKALKRHNADHATAQPQQSQPKPKPKPIDVVVDAREVSPVMDVGRRISEITGWDKDPNWQGNYSRIEVWLESGWDVEKDILPTVRKLMQGRTAPPKTIKYFEQAIADAHASRTAPVAKGERNERINTSGGYRDKADELDAAAERVRSRLGITESQSNHRHDAPAVRHSGHLRQDPETTRQLAHGDGGGFEGVSGAGDRSGVSGMAQVVPQDTGPVQYSRSCLESKDGEGQEHAAQEVG